MKEAEELRSSFSGTATLDLDEAVVVVLDLDDRSLGVRVTRPGQHRHGRVDEQEGVAELSDGADQAGVVGERWKVQCPGYSSCQTKL